MKCWQKLIERLEELVDEEGYEIALIYDDYAQLEAVAFRRYHMRPDTLKEIEAILKDLKQDPRDYTLRGWEGYAEVYIPNSFGWLEEECEEVTEE